MKALGDAKRRLSGFLSEGQRRELVMAMLGDVLETLDGSGLDGTLVVTRDPRVAELARDFGAEVMDEKGRGLNGALRQASLALAERGAKSLLAVPCDVPCVDPEDIGEIAAAFDGVGNGVGIVPDRHGLGTNALVLAPPQVIDFAFGAGSCKLHREAAVGADCLVDLPDLDRLRFDLDTSDDLEAALGWPLGPRTRTFLEKRLLGRDGEVTAGAAL